MSATYRATEYLRLSYANDHSGESDSISNQKKLVQDFLANHPDIQLVSTQVDDGYSGVIFDRPAFQAMMRDIREGKVNCVIVKDLSRLGREYIETGNYLTHTFPAFGVRFISINDGVDTANEKAGDDITVSIKNIINDAYSHDISVKTRSALQIKRKNGDYVGGGRNGVTKEGGCVTIGKIMHREVNNMAWVKVHCPWCNSDDVVFNGKSATGKQKCRCKNPDCPHKVFQLDYEQKAYVPGMKQKIVDMVMNGSGTRDTARVLGVSKDTVTKTLRSLKNQVTPVNEQYIKDLGSEIEIDIMLSGTPEEQEEQEGKNHANSDEKPSMISRSKGWH